MAPVPPTPAATLGVSSAPAFSPETVLVIGLALLFVLCASGTAALLACYTRRRRARSQAHVRPIRRVQDVESQAQAADAENVKNGSRFLAFPAPAALARAWSASTSSSSGSGSEALEKSGLGLPPPAVALAPSSRLRDSVLCKVLSQLTLPTANKDKEVKSGTAKKAANCVRDIEAAAADKANKSANGNALDSDSSLTYPEWLRPHLPEIREQAKREWTTWNPKPVLEIPEIVIQCCDDEPAIPDSPESVYSTDSDSGSSSTSSSPSVLDTPPPMTPTLASPVSFYFPASPSFSAAEYLQVPPPSFNAPREEDKPVMRNVSNFSGKTFTLAAAPGRFSKAGTLRERRLRAQQAKAQAAANGNAQPTITAGTQGLQVTKGCGSGPRASQPLTVGTTQTTGAGVTGVGLGLHLRPKQDFQGSLDKALAVSGSSGDDGAHGLSATFSTCGDLDFASVIQACATTDVVLPRAAPSQDHIDTNNTNTNNTSDGDAGAKACTSISEGVDDDNDHDKERPGRLARLIDAFDSSFSLASIDSGHVKLCDILEDYHYDHFDESFDTADPDDSAVTELVVHHSRAARRAVVVYAV
ncbi:hypothetical protein OH77DRAFT_696328 [Trametes cingulata]|nr:hypothetical protein OH77DRAFT_696328 [Trametes cingulata]